VFFLCEVTSPSKQMKYYLGNREDINERRRELYKLKKHNLSNSVPLNCNKDSSVQVEVHRAVTKHKEFLESTFNLTAEIEDGTEE
jgi:hypothetical protein